MELKIRENFISFITEKIIPKAKINEVTGKYEIKYEDYQEFDLSIGEKKILREVCTNLGISSQISLRENITCIEDEELFKEYNDIKDKLLTNISEEEKAILKQRKYQIIAKIVTDNISYIKTIINRRIANINNRYDKNNIYQLGYEMMFEYIHKNYLYKGKFKNDIGEQLIIYITRRLTLENITNIQVEDNNREQQAQTNTEIATLYYNGFEETLVDIISKKQIISTIISTLPKREQDILKLYFGFNGPEYTIIEIANIYGLTKQKIFDIIITTLETIKNSIRIKYLNEISDNKIPYECQENHQNKKLEEILIKKLPKEFLDELLNSLKGRVKQVAELYFSDKDYSISEIASILKMSYSNTGVTKSKVVLHIRNKIIEELSKQYQKEITYEEYLDYLMKIYQKQYALKRGK